MVSFPPSFLSQPCQNLYIFISCRYLISNDWKQISIWMGFLQNLFITNNAWVFWKAYFWARSLFIYQNELEPAKAADVTCQNMFTILIFGSPVCIPLISCHYYWNGWWSWVQQNAETWRADRPAKLSTWWG